MGKKKDKKKEKTSIESAPPSPGKGADLFAEIREKLEMADAMRELFDEDKVTHEHGSAEPEGD